MCNLSLVVFCALIAASVAMPQTNPPLPIPPLHPNGPPMTTMPNNMSSSLPPPPLHDQNSGNVPQPPPGISPIKFQ